MSRRILIVRLSALGDTVFTLPLLIALRQQMPQAFIGWVVGEYASPLLENLPPLNRLHVWKTSDQTPAGLWRLAREIRSVGYDASIDPQGLTRSALIPFLAGIPERIGFAPALLECRELARFFTNRQVSPPRELTHISARTIHLASALGLENPDPPPVHLPPREAAETKLARWWEENHLPRQTIIFGVGAGWPTRIWPIKEIARLAEESQANGYRCVVLWGPSEERHLADWRSLLGDQVVLAPSTDIHEMIALLKRGERYAGPDSAPLHLAWILGKPTFSWYGASDPARTAPRGPLHASVAKGPHNWRRKWSSSTGLHTLTADEVLPVFRKWLLPGPAIANDKSETTGSR